MPKKKPPLKLFEATTLRDFGNFQSFERIIVLSPSLPTRKDLGVDEKAPLEIKEMVNHKVIICK